MGISNSKSATYESPECENYVKNEKPTKKYFELENEILQTKADEFLRKNFVLPSKTVSADSRLTRIDQSSTAASPECENPDRNNGKLSEKDFEWENKPKRMDRRTLYCEYCESKLIFDSLCSLKAHFHVLHEKEGKKCIICAEIFNKNASRVTVYHHYYRKHRSNPIYKESLKQLKSSIECNFCQLKYESETSLDQHIQKCPKKETFKCICGSSFQNETTLKAHQTRYCKGKLRRRRRKD